jgi:hypothetical protein
MDPMIYTNLGGGIIAAVAANCYTVRRSEEELIGGDSKPFIYPDDFGITEATHRRVTSGDSDKALRKLRSAPRLKSYRRRYFEVVVARRVRPGHLRH